MRFDLKNIKFTVIAALLTAAAVVTVVLAVMSSGGNGIYVTQAYGEADITNISGTLPIVVNAPLSGGDIITVGEDSYCTISFEDAEDNFIILNRNTQAVIENDGTGKGMRLKIEEGSALLSMTGEISFPFTVWAGGCAVNPEMCVTKIAHSGGEEPHTDVYSFMGMASVWLRNENGVELGEIQLLGEKKNARVLSYGEEPEFSYLNSEFELDELTASDLKNLITIMSLNANFPYEPEALSDAYERSDKGGALPDAIPESVKNTETEVVYTPDNFPPEVTEVEEYPPEIAVIAPQTEPESETVLTVSETSPPATTAAPATTTPEPPRTTAATTAPTTTAAPVTTAPPVTTTAPRVYTVKIVIGESETLHEVSHGDNAVRPPDPEIDGFMFKGWDGSFENIVKDVTISAILEPINTEAEALAISEIKKVLKDGGVITLKSGTPLTHDVITAIQGVRRPLKTAMPSGGAIYAFSNGDVAKAPSSPISLGLSIKTIKLPDPEDKRSVETVYSATVSDNGFFACIPKAEIWVKFDRSVIGEMVDISDSSGKIAATAEVGGDGYARFDISSTGTWTFTCIDRNGVTVRKPQ